MKRQLKRLIRDALSSRGYVVRHVGFASQVTGIDLLKDVGVLLKDTADPILFDVGANVGQTIEAFLQSFQRPRIVSFEPSPNSYQVLHQKFHGNPNVMLENIALSDQEGNASFHINPVHSVNDSLLPYVWEEETQVVSVCLSTVDRYCETHGIEHIDLLKIDTQGNDLKVLKGAQLMLQARRIRLFVVESSFVPMYQGEPLLEDLLSFARELGYVPLGIYDQSYINNRLNYANICFECRN